jgi:CubicO group peptidase (beta-lactamase class C family)
MRFSIVRLALVLVILFAGATSVVSAEPEAPEDRDYWPTRRWRTTTLEGQAFDPNMPAIVEGRVASETPLLSALVVVRHGYIVYEQYFNGQDPDVPIHTWSVTKSVTNIAVGIAFREGLLTSTDQTLGELIPDRIPEGADPRVADITLLHLLTSTTGFQWDGRINFSRHSETDQLGLMLGRPMVCDPGDCFEYDSTNTNLLSYIVEVLSGETMAENLQTRLFDPLGIDQPEWTTMENGSTRGAGGLHLTARDMAKIGFLYLNMGVWDGERIVDEEWVEISTVEHVSGTSSTSGVNIGGGPYGYQWWVADVAGHHVYRANGYGGQFIYVVPDLDLVVVSAVAGTVRERPEDQQRIGPIINEVIIPSVLR